MAEPLAFKGGRLSELFKGGCTDDADSFRQVLVSNNIGKHWHRCLRRRLAPLFDDVAPDAVCNPRGRGAEIGARIPRAVAEWAASRGLSSAMLFLDAWAAFYMHLRRQAPGDTVSGVDVAYVLRELAIGPACMRELAQAAQGAAAMQAAGAP